MDETTRHAWIDFMKGAGGKDLLARFIANEQMFIATAMKRETAEQKGLEMARMEAIYNFRAGILDIVSPKKELKPTVRKTGRSASS